MFELPNDHPPLNAVPTAGISLQYRKYQIDLLIRSKCRRMQIASGVLCLSWHGRLKATHPTAGTTHLSQELSRRPSSICSFIAID